MPRRALVAITVAAAAMATTADAATVGVPGGPSVQVPEVKVPQLPAPPSLPKVQAPKVQGPQVKLPSAPSGARGPVQRLGGSVSGGGSRGSGAGGSGAPASGVAGSSAARSAGSRSGFPPSSAGGSRDAAPRGSRGRPLTARQRRARDVRERRKLRRGVQRLRGCLGVVSSFEREVLVLRSGISGPEQSRAQVAQELDTSVGRVQRGERSGLRGLRDAARSTGCSGGAAMSFSDPGSDQMASATVAVATGGAPALRPVPTMVGSDDSRLASVRTRPARQVLGVSADSETAAPDQSGSPLTALPRTASVNIPDGSPSPLFLLFLLLALVPLTIVALRRRGATAGPAPSLGPEPHAAPAPPQPAVPLEPRAKLERDLPPEPQAETEPAGSEWLFQPGPAPHPVADPPPDGSAALPGSAHSEPAPASPPPKSRGRAVAALASGLASVAVGDLFRRRRRGHRRR